MSYNYVTSEMEQVSQVSLMDAPVPTEVMELGRSELSKQQLAYLSSLPHFKTLWEALDGDWPYWQGVVSDMVQDTLEREPEPFLAWFLQHPFRLPVLAQFLRFGELPTHLFLDKYYIQPYTLKIQQSPSPAYDFHNPETGLIRYLRSRRGPTITFQFLGLFGGGYDICAGKSYTLFMLVRGLKSRHAFYSMFNQSCLLTNYSLDSPLFCQENNTYNLVTKCTLETFLY